MANIMKVGGLASAGAGKGLYYVELPRSIYYGDAAEWLVSRPDTVNEAYSFQIVCNGELWTFSNAYGQLGTGARATNVRSTNLATKEITYTGTITNGTTLYYFSGAMSYTDVTTDGTSRIWFVTASVGSGMSTTGKISIYLHEFNVLTKEFKSTLISDQDASYGSTYFVGYGILHYSQSANKVYLFNLGEYGGFTGSTSRVRERSFSYNLETNELYSFPTKDSGIALSNGYAYEKDGYIYYGGGYYASSGSTFVKNPNIYRYSMADATFTIVKTDLNTQIEDGTCKTLCFVLGDKVVQANATNTFVFDPITGNTVEEQFVAPYGTDITIRGRMQGLYDNVFYIWTQTTDKALMELHFWQNTPADSPLVAKIYKGQKFHTLVPFRLKRQNIDVTTTQQTAAQDIDIKMYDYSSEGGQILYIENA